MSLARAQMGVIPHAVASANRLGGYNTVPTSVIEREKKQGESLELVKRVVKNIGGNLPIINSEDGTFSQEPGFYLIDSDITQRGEITNAEFDFNKRLLSRAADSAHAVIAGDMVLTHNKGQTSHMIIAAKPYIKRDYSQRFQRVTQEVNVMHDMWESGEVGVRPIAVAVTPNFMGDKLIIFSKYDHTLTTMDTQPWGSGLTPANIRNATLAVKALGRFNEMGYRHGDAKIKNVASRLGKGQLGMIDFETTTKIDPNNLDQLEGAILVDLEMLLDSLASLGMFHRHVDAYYQDNSRQILDGIRTICQDGYLSCWQDSPTKVQDKVLETVVHVSDTVAKHVLKQVQYDFSI